MAKFNVSKGQPETPETWETVLTKIRQQEYVDDVGRRESMKRAWENLILDGKLPYMAMLRNLHTFLDYELRDEAIQAVVDKLLAEVPLLQGRQALLRFYEAYRNIVDHPRSKDAARLRRALEKAITMIRRVEL